MPPRIQPTNQPDDDPPRKVTSNDMRIDITQQSYEERWSDESVLMTVRRWQLTNEEQQELRELQMRLRNVSHWKNNPQEVVRYLRGPGLFEEGTLC